VIYFICFNQLRLYARRPLEPIHRVA